MRGTFRRFLVPLVFVSALTIVTTSQVGASSLTPDLKKPTAVLIAVGVGTATVTWKASLPAAKVSHYSVTALPSKIVLGKTEPKNCVSRSLICKFSGLTKGANYTFYVEAIGLKTKDFSGLAKSATVVIKGAATTTTTASNANARACALNLSNWVIATYNVIQSNPSSIPQVITTFGVSSPIEQWVMSEESGFVSKMFTVGQTAAESQVQNDALQECSSLAAHGTNIGTIPAPPA